VIAARFLAVLAILALAGLLVILLRRESRARERAQSDFEGARARLRFYATMSHEMRTALNGILGVAGVLLEMPLESTERGHVQLIQDSGIHLQNLINDVLDMSRIEAGKLHLVETAFEVRKVLRSAIDMLDADAQTKGLTLTIDVADDVPRRAGGDPQRIRQVLLNIVGNAVKFTREGSVTVNVTRGTTRNGSVQVLFSVTDTGIGIAPRALTKLFNDFAQADGSIARRFGGSGLGLAISKALVERMGGTITVESTQGVGTTFHFQIVLRARRASDDPNAPAAVAVATRPGGWRVLVVEDNATNQLVVRALLEGMGHRVTTVDGGEPALAEVQANEFDLVLMDLMMPGMDGLEATRAIRALSSPAAKLPIIGLSAANDAEDAAAGREAGMDYFASKPITGAQLEDAIAQVMASLLRGRGGEHRSGGENRGFDPAALDRLTGDIGVEATLKVIRLFVRDAGQTVEAMRQQVEAGLLAEIASSAQSLSNAARGLGLLRIGRTANDLEADAKRGETQAVRDRLDRLRALLAEDLDELREFRPTSQ
jgi:CheY-like chemotaxis protein/nitrogen-specific signal transduction histidine kinase/HPt (histidine-containing phosphotransfer) domain-containing protein